MPQASRCQTSRTRSCRRSMPRGSHIVPALLLIAGANHLLPTDAPVPSPDAYQPQVLLLIRTRHKHRIVPDNRSSAAVSRKRSDPHHVVRLAPLRWQIGLGRRTIKKRSSPLRPVLSPAAKSSKLSKNADDLCRFHNSKRADARKRVGEGVRRLHSFRGTRRSAPVHVRSKEPLEPAVFGPLSPEAGP